MTSTNFYSNVWTVKMLPPPIVMRNGVHVEAKTCIDTYKALMKQG
jgi:hypothetical protein